jgi:DNA-binding MarR family transcriptional regulator
MNKMVISAEQRSVLLHRLGFLQDKVVDQALKNAVGTGLSQFKVLYALSENRECSQCEVARSLDITEAAVSRQIALLEKGGYVQSSISGTNLRAKTLTLTEKGKKVVEKAWATIANIDAQLWSDVSVEDQGIVKEALDKVVVRLLKMCGCE